MNRQQPQSQEEPQAASPCCRLRALLPGAGSPHSDASPAFPGPGWHLGVPFTLRPQSTGLGTREGTLEDKTRGLERRGNETLGVLITCRVTKQAVTQLPQFPRSVETSVTRQRLTAATAPPHTAWGPAAGPRCQEGGPFRGLPATPGCGCIPLASAFTWLLYVPSPCNCVSLSLARTATIVQGPICKVRICK